MIQKKMFSIKLLSILIVFQSCTIYKFAPVTLEEAHKAELKTKVLTNEGKKLKFKRIAFENGNYYGVKRVKGDIYKIVLDENSIDKIKIKDRILSIISNVLPVPILLIILFGVAYSGPELGGGLQFPN